MTQQNRMCRAEELVLHHGESETPSAEARRLVNPSAAKPGKRCIGVAARPCGKEIPALGNRKRCDDCSRENERLLRKSQNRDYYQRHQGRLKEKRLKRKKQKHVSEVIAALGEWLMANGVSIPSASFEPGERDYMERSTTGARKPRGRRVPPQRAAAGKVGETQRATTIHGNQRKRRGAKQGRPRLSAAQKIERRKNRATSLFVRVKIEKKPHHVAWYETNPRSKATRETAQREAQRELAWLCKEYPPDMEDALALTGLYDHGVYCRHIKEVLKATKAPMTDHEDEAPAFPDWNARREGLKLLMIGLELATPRGFRSGPRALGGALADVPIEMTGAPPGDEDALADVLRRLKEEAIVFRHYVEKKALAECWFEVNPRSAANRRTAKKEAKKLVDSYKARCSSSLIQRLVAAGLDNFTVVRGIKEMMEATLVRDNTRTDVPDWRVRQKAMDLLLVLRGYQHPTGSGRRGDHLTPIFDVAASRRSSVN